MPIGVLFNSFVVLTGGLAGAAIGRKLSRDIADHLPSAFGLVAMGIGINLVVKVNSLTPVALALIIGTIVGEGFGIESKAKSLINRIVGAADGHDPGKTETLVIAIVLFCFSGTGIFGALNEGFTGDGSVLITKSVLDFFTALIFGASAGVFVGLVALPQVLIGLALFFSAGFVVPLLSPAMLNDFKAAGGLITLAAAFKVAGIKNMRAMNMLPALVLVFFFSYFWTIFTG